MGYFIRNFDCSVLLISELPLSPGFSAIEFRFFRRMSLCQNFQETAAGKKSQRVGQPSKQERTEPFWPGCGSRLKIPTRGKQRVSEHTKKLIQFFIWLTDVENAYSMIQKFTIQEKHPFLHFADWYWKFRLDNTKITHPSKKVKESSTFSSFFYCLPIRGLKFRLNGRICQKMPTPNIHGGGGVPPPRPILHLNTKMNK